MKTVQRTLTLRPKERGFHLVTREITGEFTELAQCRAGILHIFIAHTSASLTVNENADPSVRADMEKWFARSVPEGFPFSHVAEGPDDMPAHIKASLLGSSVTVPVTNGTLRLGTWQGIYLGEHRDEPSARELHLTLVGEFA